MTVAEIQVDQRVIGIDSRRFASVEKALVELITNSDDSYARLEKAGAPVTGRIRVGYERHHAGAVLMVSDQAEGMSFEQAGRILSYGGAHSPLSRGEGNGRGYFGRGLKQAIFGLGHGWIETIQDGRFTRVDVFRGENGGYLYDDDGADRRAFPADYARLGISANDASDAAAGPGTGNAAGNGTRVTIVVDNPHVTITQHATLLQSLSDNIYLRDVLDRRDVELVHGRPGAEDHGSESIRFQEPPATVLLGPERPGSFSLDGGEYPFTAHAQAGQGRGADAQGRRTHQRPGGPVRHGRARLPAVRVREPGGHGIPLRHGAVPGADRDAGPGQGDHQRRAGGPEPQGPLRGGLLPRRQPA